VTCLNWQRTPAPSTCTFTQEEAYWAGLTLGGGGWQLWSPQFIIRMRASRSPIPFISAIACGWS
jgi:hypothetical protein